MHEMAIARGILDITLDNATQYVAHNAVGKVIAINLLIGQMTGVEPESLRFCFRTLAEGTIAEAAELKINIVPLVGYCQDCNSEFGIEAYRFLCSTCGSANVEIISGRELKVEYLEVE